MTLILRGPAAVRGPLLHLADDRLVRRGSPEGLVDVMSEALYVWAEEGGIELKLSRPAAHRVVVEIVTRAVEEKVHATATMAAFRHQRIADFFALSTPLTGELVAALNGCLDAMDNHEGCSAEYTDAEVAARAAAMAAIKKVTA